MAFAPYLFITTPYFLFDLSLIYIPLLHYVSKASLIYLIIWYVVLIVQHLSKRARERKIDVSVIERVGIIAFRVFTILYLIISTTLAIYGIVLTVTSNNFSSFLTLFASLCDLVAAVLCIFIPIAQVCNNRVTVVVLAVVVTLLAGIGMTVQLSLSDIYYREHNTTAHTNATLVYVILCIILKITFFLFAILFTGTIAYIRNDVLSKLWHETKINKADMVIEDPDETETFTDDIKHLIIKVDDISIDGRIAEGSFGVVFGGKYRGSLVAIKKMKRDEEGEEFKHEVKMLNSLRHPNIVLFMGACLGTEFKFIVTEKMATSLDAVLHPKKSTGLHSILSFDQKVQIATDIARAVAYMHARTPPICHRDLKPSNILVCSLFCTNNHS
jgi:predicted secreted protein